MRQIVIAAILGSITGVVSAQEDPKSMFKKLDQDSNGVVTHNELMVEASKHFAEFDRDNNGIILLSELPQEMPLRGPQRHRLGKIKARMEERAERHGDDWEPKVSPEDVEDRMRRSRLKFMARLDKDENEQLSVEEFAAPMIKRFKMADSDGDGSVTEAELDDALQNRPRNRGNKRKARGAF